ncbi:hypothetical protein BH10CHL1_BH10CHL1_43880 [soil metagenome]
MYLIINPIGIPVGQNKWQTSGVLSLAHSLRLALEVSWLTKLGYLIDEQKMENLR